MIDAAPANDNHSPNTIGDLPLIEYGDTASQPNQAMSRQIYDYVEGLEVVINGYHSIIQLSIEATNVRQQVQRWNNE